MQSDRSQFVYLFRLLICLMQRPSELPCLVPQVLLGVMLDAAAATRPVDMGPAAEDAAAAAEFRAFWGDKAELRRFPVCSQKSIPGLLQCAP
jgi:Nrap protein domain 3